MTDPIERLIAAWVRWEAAPASNVACNERLDAIAAAGLDSTATHQTVAAGRRAGMSIPDAIQQLINDQVPA